MYVYYNCNFCWSTIEKKQFRFFSFIFIFFSRWEINLLHFRYKVEDIYVFLYKFCGYLGMSPHIYIRKVVNVIGLRPFGLRFIACRFVFRIAVAVVTTWLVSTMIGVEWNSLKGISEKTKCNFWIEQFVFFVFFFEIFDSLLHSSSLIELNFY